MYKESFKELVKIAFEKSEKLEIKKTNPYFIGFGNPNSEILILGQEKAINQDNLRQIEVESIENPKQWNKIVNENITDIDFKFYEDYFFKNPLHPYSGKPSKGNTWNHYQKLLKLIYPELNETINSFMFKSFISEINHQVSPNRLGNQTDEERKSFNSNKFYKEFKVTILAIGDYLNKNEIEENYNVSFSEDKSEPRKKMVLYKNINEQRILINTRQLSNDVSNDYLIKISNLIKNHLG